MKISLSLASVFRRYAAAQLLAAVGVDFFFFEMDVWMLRSPMAAARQNSTVDMMLALHQVRARRSYYCYSSSTA